MDEIDVISHSMGVPLTRRALKGGWAKLPNQDQRRDFGEENIKYYIGRPLTDKVRHFIGIVGPNYGVHNCTNEDFRTKYQGCNKQNGFYPGSEDSEPWPEDMSFWL